MGYTTEFTGHIKLSRPLTIAEAKTLLEFNEDPDTIEKPNPGGYMQWVPSKTLDQIGWDGNEKFYDYTEWLQWLCRWLTEHGIGTVGVLKWRGESRDDMGEITVVDGNVMARPNDKRSSSTFTPIDLDDLARMVLEQAAKS